MTETILMPKHFKEEKIAYVGPKVNKYKAKSVYINYNGKNPLIFKTPTMNCPFGVSTYTTEGTDSYTKYTLDCSFKGMDSNPELKSFYNALTTLDTMLVNDACKNSLAWFTKKKMSHEVALNFYQPNIRYSTDKDGEVLTQYAPRFKVKIPVRYGRVDCAIWRDLPFSLNGWSSDELALLNANVLQLECEIRGLESSREESEMVNALLEWASSTSEDEYEGLLSSIPAKYADISKMYRSSKGCRPVKLNISPDELTTYMKRVRVSLVTKCRSVWFTGGKFGCSWEVLHMKIHPVVDTTPVLSPTEIDMDQVNFTDARVNKYGGKSVSLKYGDNQMRIALPKMTMPFGVSKYTPEGSDTSKYTIDVSFRDKEDNEEIQALFDFFNSLDEKMVESACENSLSWFTKKKMTPEVVQAILKPSLRYSTDRETGELLTQYAPRFSARVPFYGGNLGVKVYDEDGVEMKGLEEDGRLESVLSKNSQVELKVRCSSVWLGSGRFGLTWDIYEATVYPGESLDNYVFGGDDDDVHAEIIEDTTEESEEEEEESEEEEEEDELEAKPPTPPPAKKRRGRKKKVVAEA